MRLVWVLLRLRCLLGLQVEGPGKQPYTQLRSSGEIPHRRERMDNISQGVYGDREEKLGGFRTQSWGAPTLNGWTEKTEGDQPVMRRESEESDLSENRDKGISWRKVLGLLSQWLWTNPVLSSPTFPFSLPPASACPYPGSARLYKAFSLRACKPCCHYGSMRYNVGGHQNGSEAVIAFWDPIWRAKWSIRVLRASLTQNHILWGQSIRRQICEASERAREGQVSPRRCISDNAKERWVWERRMEVLQRKSQRHGWQGEIGPELELEQGIQARASWRPGSRRRWLGLRMGYKDLKVRDQLACPSYITAWCAEHFQMRYSARAICQP